MTLQVHCNCWIDEAAGTRCTREAGHDGDCMAERAAGILSRLRTAQIIMRSGHFVKATHQPSLTSNSTEPTNDER